ncbi:BRO1 domain-containing protein [Mastigocoleus testarum]|uniref:Uncharacterized protein n=1 Tax=Mastigocoleus testarum BC008 TaxID=371196 RepID=A0A0V7ZMC4_9CYAN|nr:hypothetical protein [Mastigocoleus testarum]KST65828.1 hypothetical protein BC008_22880 [Mastigocoleus testarum BC008]
MSDTVETNKTPTFPKIKLILIGVSATIVTGAAIYGIGWWQGRSHVSVNNEEITEEIKSVRQELQQTQNQLEAVRNYGYLMQARAALYHSAVDLDQRNFGTANTRLQEASTALGEVKDNSGTLDINKISSLQKNISQTNINVAVNLQKQRRQILKHVNQLNSLIPEETPINNPTSEEKTEK